MPATSSSLGLEDQTIVVTGASRGIGEATARVLSAAGARVALAARSVDRLETLASELSPDGDDALPVRCDIGDPDEVHQAARRVLDWSGQVDAVAHVAGYPLTQEAWDGRLHDQPPELFEAVRRVDLDGARHWTQAVLPHMIEQGAGNLCYVSSTPALEGYKGTPYTEAKAALLGLMRDVAREYGPDGIRANAVALGNIATEATLDHTDDAYDELAQEAALGRWGQPEEAARAIALLLSPLAGYVTGQTLVVDGGGLMR